MKISCYNNLTNVESYGSLLICLLSLLFGQCFSANSENPVISCHPIFQLGLILQRKFKIKTFHQNLLSSPHKNTKCPLADENFPGSLSNDDFIK